MTNTLITGALIQRVMRETNITSHAIIDHTDITGIIYAAGRKGADDSPWGEDGIGADEVMAWKVEDEEDHVFLISVEIIGVDLRSASFDVKDLLGPRRTAYGTEGVRTVLEQADGYVQRAVAKLADLVQP